MPRALKIDCLSFLLLGWGMASFLLLRRPMSFFFIGRTRSSSLHYLFTLLFPPPLGVNLFGPER